MKATGELKAAVDADGPSGAVSVEVKALLIAQAASKYVLSWKWRLQGSSRLQSMLTVLVEP